MTADAGRQSVAETLNWLEQQLAEIKELQAHQNQTVEQVQRQLHYVTAEADEAQREARQVDPKIAHLKGVPDKLVSLAEDAERIRTTITNNKAEVDNALRLLRAEADQDRQERAEAMKRIERATSELALLAADMAQAQNQVSQVSQVLSTVLERQAEVEHQTEQFALRLERAIEVTHGLEGRLMEKLTADQEERFALVFERLQLVGEMIRRNEEKIAEATAEQTLRDDVLQEIGAWRDQHERIEVRLSQLDEVTDRLLGETDKLRGDVALIEGRHAGLGERVAGMRRDITEIVDQVREEFAKFSKMIEKQRRKQIEVLEQELRETKFHAFRPPEEP